MKDVELTIKIPMELINELFLEALHNNSSNGEDELKGEYSITNGNFRFVFNWYRPIFDNENIEVPLYATILSSYSPSLIDFEICYEVDLDMENKYLTLEEFTKYVEDGKIYLEFEGYWDTFEIKTKDEFSKLIDTLAQEV